MNVYSALLSSGYQWQVPVIAIYRPSFPSIGENYPLSSIRGRTLQCHINCNVCCYSFSTWPPKSNKIKMSRARVKYICQNAIHLISRFGCVEFGNLMPFIVWPLVPAHTGKGTESAWVYSRLCWERSWFFPVWLKNTLLCLKRKCFSIATTAQTLYWKLYIALCMEGRERKTSSWQRWEDPATTPSCPLVTCGISFRSLGLAAEC